MDSNRKDWRIKSSRLLNWRSIGLTRWRRERVGLPYLESMKCAWINCLLESISIPTSETNKVEYLFCAAMRRGHNIMVRIFSDPAGAALGAANPPYRSMTGRWRRSYSFHGAQHGFEFPYDEKARNVDIRGYNPAKSLIAAMNASGCSSGGQWPHPGSST